MSEIQTVSAIIEQNNEVATYEKLVCKSENALGTFNNYISGKYHDLLSNKYHCLAPIDYHDMLYGEYDSVSSGKYCGILSCAYRAVLYSNHHGVLPKEYHDMLVSGLPDITLSINSGKDMIEYSGMVYSTNKNKTYVAHVTETNQISNCRKFLLQSDICQNDAEANSTISFSGYKKNADYRYYSPTNCDYFTPGYLSAKSLRCKCSIYCDIGNFSLDSKHSCSWQVSGAENLLQEIVANENESIYSEINRASAANKLLKTLMPNECDVSESQRDNACVRGTDSVVKLYKEADTPYDGASDYTIPEYSTGEISAADTGYASVTVGYASVIDELQPSRNNSNFYSQIGDVNMLSTSSLTMENDSGGIYDEIIGSNGSRENYPENNSIGHAIGANVIQQKFRNVEKTIWIGVVSKRYCLNSFKTF